jgi:AraC family transcriptional activator of pobA
VGLKRKINKMNYIGEKIIDRFYRTWKKQPFFHNFGNLDQYNIFQPKGTHVFSLDDDQIKHIDGIFQKMWAELNSDYIYKNDVLRNYIFEIIHFALKLHPNFLACV